MKKLFTIICLLILSSNSYSEEISGDQVEIKKNGLVYETNSDTPFTGTVVWFQKDGKLVLRDNYQEGVQDGLYESFYENGQLYVKRNYKDGEVDGPYEWFYENGQLEEIKYFIKGTEVRRRQYLRSR